MIKIKLRIVPKKEGPALIIQSRDRKNCQNMVANLQFRL